MSNFSKEINDFFTCEVWRNGNCQCFAKTDDGHWAVVLDNGDLDGAEMAAADFNTLLKTLESIGAEVRFTNHSAV